VSDVEQVLYTFGPFGTSVCDGPYGVFKWQRTNTVRVELTDRVLRGRKQRSFFVFNPLHSSGKVLFAVPYAGVLLVRRTPHPAKLGLMDVLELTFSVGDGEKVLSIAGYKDPVDKALAVLRRFVPPERIQG
jgi:hypothetical protein